MLPAARLRDRLARHELITGVLASFHVWPNLVPLCKDAGLDYLIVDLEHGSYGLDLVSHVCTMGRQLEFAVFIRPAAKDFDTLRLLVDQGPVGFLLPYVEDPAELDVVRAAVCMPPRGRRRPGGVGNFWVSDYSLPTWQQEVEARFMVLPQIESRRGLTQAEAIAAHEMTTAIAVGPYDLSADLGVCGQMDHATLQEALRQVRAAGQKAGKETWMIGGDGPKMAREGWRFLCIGEPSFVLQGALKERLQQTRAVLGSGS